MSTANTADARWTFWIDRGGTFTDVIGLSPQGATVTLKLPSRSRDYEDAAIEAMRRLLDLSHDDAFPADRVAAIRLGTTVATNALLERKGAKTLLITTLGFADALIIGDQRRPDLFALKVMRPPPLFAKVIEADERLSADGSVVRPLDEAALAAALDQASAEGFESAAVAFMHSDLNPDHELRAAGMARAAGIGFVAVGAEVSPLPRFLARAETAVVDAYLTPVLRAYVDRLAKAVGQADLTFMTSAGGLVRAHAFRGRDAVLSGPAGGVVGVAQTAQAAGVRAVLGFDMGGTSTDVCRFAGSLERRDATTVSGVRLGGPMLDVESVAAGGGSILAFDGLRARVGPASAGAIPGPAAYGLGGPATVTDANLVLGRLNGGFFPRVFGPDGRAPLDVGAARARLQALASAMGLLSPEAAAKGFLAVTVEQTAGAIRRVSTERGFDPRGHALVAFGGAAGQIVCDVAGELGMDEVLCPRHGSLLSAWGIGHARISAAAQAGLGRPLDRASIAAAMRLGEALSQRVKTDMVAQHAEIGVLRQQLSLSYDGAEARITTPMGSPAQVRKAFESAHQRLFGFTQPDHPIIIASVEAEAEEEGAIPHLDHHAPARTATLPTVEDEGATQVIPADCLQGATDGPALIVRGDTQIWLEAGWRASPGPEGLIRLNRFGASGRSAISMAPDPVTLELFNRRFMGVAEAMGAALERTAQSVNIKERLDFSCALFDEDGGLVANAPHMPVHLGSMGASVRAVRARHPHVSPGDAFALNNPYAGGTHLPDITVVMPVFADGDAQPSFFVAARGHHADVGGIQPGSMPPFSRTIDEEGVMLDALPVLRHGRLLEPDVIAALIAGPWPARTPQRNIGDLKAQIAACQAGAAAVLAMITNHGRAAVARYMGLVQANAEACVRRAVGRLADGAAHAPMDGGATIAVTVSVDSAAGEATLDFSGSSPQLSSNFNAPASIVDAAALYVFRTLVDDDIPLNAGCLAPLRIIVPRGSMLNPALPAAVVAGNVETSQHLVDALYAALGVMANSQGTMNNFTFGDARRQYYETICGGVGATADGAGANAIHSHMTNSRMTDPEILERRFPVQVELFAVRRGSGGQGKHRGGDGAVRRIRFLEPMEAALLSTRRDNSPQGLSGGGAGAVGRQRLITRDGKVKELAGCFSVVVRSGDVIEIETPGGGGFGPSETAASEERRNWHGPGPDPGA